MDPGNRAHAGTSTRPLTGSLALHRITLRTHPRTKRSAAAAESHSEPHRTGILEPHAQCATFREHPGRCEVLLRRIRKSIPAGPGQTSGAPGDAASRETFCRSRKTFIS